MHVAGNKLDGSGADNGKPWKKKLWLGGKQCEGLPHGYFNLTWAHYEHALLERISCNHTCASSNMFVSVPLKHAKPEY